MNPMIVDLLAKDKTIIPSLPGVPVIGKFERGTNTLDQGLAMIRSMAIIDEIGKHGGNPSPITFYVDESWQGFAIVSAVAGFYGVSPRVLVMSNKGILEDLVDFFDPKIVLQISSKEGTRANA